MVPVIDRLLETLPQLNHITHELGTTERDMRRILRQLQRAGGAPLPADQLHSLLDMPCLNLRAQHTPLTMLV